MSVYNQYLPSTDILQSYHVDRKESVEVLRRFLDQEDQKIEEEVAWLRDNGVDCVLSDAAYMPWWDTMP